MANEEVKKEVIEPAPAVEEDVDDEPDEWDKRIFSTGCAEENTALNDCFREKLDWRACKEQMDLFKQCWKQRGNDQRTESKDAE